MDTANSLGFDYSCRPEQGRLLGLLAAGVGDGAIGETGTGCGVGLAWMASAAHPGALLTSVERDPVRARAARDVFDGDGQDVRVIDGDWSVLAAHGPFDLLVLDGGGQGKSAEPSFALGDWVRPGGLVVIDDITPFDTWPPRHDGEIDHARLHWLQHDQLLAVELPLTQGMATIVGRYVGD